MLSCAQAELTCKPAKVLVCGFRWAGKAPSRALWGHFTLQTVSFTQRLLLVSLSARLACHL